MHLICYKISADRPFQAFVNSHFISPRSIWDDPDHLKTSVESRDAGTAMRILCLGASITFGVGSTDGNGYRAKLRTLLVASGNKVHFVGTQSSGNMENNANKGYPGFRIDQVTGFAWNAYGYYPNVVCIHLGTNDFAQGYDPTTSAERMGILVDEIYSVLS
jgi:lysophospholipase L1-like esterase